MKFNSIIISGLPGSGKTTLAEKLSEHYNWQIYSIGQLWRDKWTKLYPNKEVSFSDFWRSTTLEENREINIKARDIFKNGNIIADIRYAIYARDLPALFLFVTSPLEVRAKRALNSGKYEEYSLEKIKDILIKREKDELITGRQLIDGDYDYRDPSSYHLIINSGMLSIEEEFYLIRNLLQ